MLEKVSNYAKIVIAIRHFSYSIQYNDYYFIINIKILILTHSNLLNK